MKKSRNQGKCTAERKWWGKWKRVKAQKSWQLHVMDRYKELDCKKKRPIGADLIL